VAVDVKEEEVEADVGAAVVPAVLAAVDGGVAEEERGGKRD